MHIAGRAKVGLSKHRSGKRKLNMKRDVAAFWSRVRHSAILYGTLGTSIRIGANVLLLPLVLTRLSSPELATWWVFAALGAVANLADFGFGQVITRVYSILWAGAEDFDEEGLRPPSANRAPNLPRISQLHATVRHLYWRIAFAAAVLLAVGGTSFLMISTNGNVRSDTFWASWAAYVLVIFYSVGTTHWLLACQGIGRVREMQLAFLWSGLAYLIVAGVMLMLGAGLMAMVAATGVKGWVARSVGRRAYLTALPEGTDSKAQVELSMLARLWPNARKFAVLSLGAYLVYNGSVLVSSLFMSDEVTASFGLTAQVGLFLQNFSALWLAVKWPHITMLRAQGRLEEMGVLFARRLVLVMGSFIVLAIGLALFVNPLLEWKGTHTRLLPAAYLIVYLLHLGQQQLYIQFGLLTFTENVVPYYRLTLYTGLGLFGLSMVLTSWLGEWGLVLSPLIATGAACSWYPVWRGFQGQPLSPRQFVRAAVRGHL